MKRKCLALLLSVAMISGLMGGCGKETATDSVSEGNEQVQPEKPSSEDTADAAESGGTETAEDYYVDEDGNQYQKFDDVQLKMLVCWNGGFPTASDQYNNDVAKAIRERIGVTVEFEGIMMSETEKLNMMFTSGEMPDMVNAPFWGGNAGETAVIKKAGQEGRLIDIKDLVPQYPNIADAYDIGVISKKYLETDIDIPENNGARYVLPTEVSGDEADIQNWAYGVFVRGDVPEALGIDPSEIKTAEELYDFMTKAKEYGFKDVNGNDCIVASTLATGFAHEDFAQSFTSKNLTSYRLNEDGTVDYWPLTEGWVEQHLFIWRMVNEGIMDLECFGQTDDRAREKIGNGTVLFLTGQYGDLIKATQQSGLYNSNPEMRLVPVGPLNYSDGSALKQLEAEGRSGSPVIFFPSTCSNIDAALTWLDYVNSKEGMRLICYGFEGDTYEITADGQTRMTEELTERYKQDADGVKEELRERGINYMQGRTYVARKNMVWFGELAPFEADAEPEELTEYKKKRPIEVIPGYQIDAVASNYEGYSEMAEWAFDSKSSDYIQRSYFADTEDEARGILEEYQEYLRTNDGGKFMDYLSWMTEQSKTRDDFAY